jgi:putative addiction module component (TIGR02574 family)
MAATINEIKQLSVAERIQLVEDIWDSLAATPEALPLTDAQRRELDARLSAYQQNPDSMGWNEVKANLKRSS